MYDKDELPELLELLDMEDFCNREGIDHKLTRGSSGIQINVKECPVCHNTKWKVYLNAETGLGNCFAGDHPPGQNFTKWKFARAHFGDQGAQEVIAHLKQYAKDAGWRAKRKTSVAVEDRPNVVFPTNSVPLPHPLGNLKYLTNRGIDPDTTRYFHLHYCADGTFRYKLGGDWHFQNYYRRLIIPVHDLDGKLVTFQGRTLVGEEPKYLFPPGLEASGTHLYNGFNVHDTRRVVVGEGAFDVMALKLAMDADPGLRDVIPVGTFGKHLSWGDEHSQQYKFLKLKERGVEEVTIMWDGEIKATDDAIEAAKRLVGIGLKVRIALLPPLKDPNEVPKEKVQKAFYEAIPFTGANAAIIMMQRRSYNKSALRTVHAE
jgi:DNA primase